MKHLYHVSGYATSEELAVFPDMFLVLVTAFHEIAISTVSKGFFLSAFNDLLLILLSTRILSQTLDIMIEQTEVRRCSVFEYHDVIAFHADDPAIE